MNFEKWKSTEKSACKFCNSPNAGIPPAIHNSVCHSAACQEKYRAELNQQYRDEQLRQRELRQQFVSRILQRHRFEQQVNAKAMSADAGHTSDDPNLPYVAVPANVRPVVELPTIRKDQFLTHLRQITEAVFQEAPRSVNQGTCVAGDSEVSLTATADVTTIVSAACGTCRGYCCRHGGHHAFFYQEHVQNLREQLPSITAPKLIDLIAGHLPHTSVEDSCVMHGAHGCELPRAYRSKLCNRFECSDLVNIADTVDTTPVLIVAIDGERLVRQTMYEPLTPRDICPIDEA